MLFLARIVASLALLSLLLPAGSRAQDSGTSVMAEPEILEQAELHLTGTGDRNLINVSGLLRLNPLYTCQDLVRSEMQKHCDCRKRPTVVNRYIRHLYPSLYYKYGDTNLLPRTFTAPGAEPLIGSSSLSTSNGVTSSARARRAFNDYDGNGNDSGMQKRSGKVLTEEVRKSIIVLASKCCSDDTTCNLTALQNEINTACNPNLLCFSQGRTHN